MAAPYTHFQSSRSPASGVVLRSASLATWERTGLRQPCTGPVAHVGGAFGLTVMRTVAGLESLVPSFTS